MTPSSIFILIIASHYQYDDHTIAVNGNQSAFVLEDNSGVIPEPQENYVVQNIGRTPVRAQVWYGTEILPWLGIIDAAAINPGEKIELDNGGRRYYITGLKIVNPNDTRAIIHAEGGDLPTPFVPPSILIEKVLRELLGIGMVKLLPFGKYLHRFVDLIDFFWPHHQPDIWQNMTDKILPVLNEKEIQLVHSLLNNKIRVYKDQIKSLQQEIDDGEKPQEHYNSIAYSLIGVEQEFIFNNMMDNYKEINLSLLPMYSKFVSMKMNFYILGLTDNNIIDIKRYMNKTVEGANKYIMSMRTEPIDAAYNSSPAAGIFDSMMTVRTHLALHGEEYLPFWKKMAVDPTSNQTVYNDVISFSSFFGRPTANLYAQATPREVPEPLQPKLMNGRRNTLVSVRVYLSDQGSVAGLRLEFSNKAAYDLGLVTDNSSRFDFSDTHIESLQAFGDGRVDGLQFRLGSGDTWTFGKVTSKISKKFQLANHRIASIYVANDSRYLGYPIANIAVSYQWLY
ncbi:unnamed protein product [Phaedon cochleariae]|uniref:KA1 domain-containing protein n=1 Tax=Phaedon cochleariae TaxID=80249 RepID=A0A9N9WYU5_PHACE|nr:unnamed protein product [Phaedon cochleariae]